MKNKLLFFGTPPFAAEILQFLFEKKAPIVGVVTQPDRSKGRSRSLTPSALKEFLLKIRPEMPLFSPQKASDPEFLQALEALQADLYIVVAYGQILSQKLLSIPPLGSINIHASLLPEYRGAAPMQRALFDGKKETGIAIQKVVRELDAGDVIASKSCPIPPEMTLGELQDKLCHLAKPLLWEVLQLYETGEPKGEPQDPSRVTFAPKITPEERFIDWNLPAEKIHNQIRALSPEPGAWCWIQEGTQRIQILKTRLRQEQGAPGEILSRREALVACQTQSLELLEVKPEGKRTMRGVDFFQGNALFQKFPAIPLDVSLFRCK